MWLITSIFHWSIPSFLIISFRYDTVFTMFPVFSLVLDEDVNETIAFRFPELYIELQKVTVYPLPVLWSTHSSFYLYQLIKYLLCLYHLPHFTNTSTIREELSPTRRSSYGHSRVYIKRVLLCWWPSGYSTTISSTSYLLPLPPSSWPSCWTWPLKYILGTNIWLYPNSPLLPSILLACSSSRLILVS